MSRGSRKKANQAEAIVSGIGAIFMLILLYILTTSPQLFKGQSTDEMLRTFIRIVGGFVALSAVITAIGLVVWFRVKKGKR